MPRGTPIPPVTHDVFHIGEWLVEPELNRIERNDETLHLEPKIMEVLVHLARHGPRVVTRQQLIDEVWDGGYITDNTLTHAITEIRRALGDSASKPRYIETIHRRGYRLVEPVTNIDGRPPSVFGQPSRFSVFVENRHIQLREGENLIGRVPGASLFINSPQVSRRHARITVEDGNAYLEDQGSKNGTLLNGRPVWERERLQDGDRIFLGDGTMTMRFIEDGSKDQPEPMDIITPTSTLLNA